MQITKQAHLIGWLENLSNLIKTNKTQGPNFLKPFHLLTLAIEAKRHQKNGLKLPDELQSYAARMKLWEAAGMQSDYKYSSLEASESGKFLPVQALTSKNEVSTTATKLVKIAELQIPNSESQFSLDILLFELLGNYYDHAQDEICGLACAQSWPNGNLAQIAIADGGIGIRASLEKNLHLSKRLQSENACAIATEYGVTSKPNYGHSGYGLTLARDTIKNNGGAFILISGNEGFIEENGSSSHFVIPAATWKGTLLILEWYLNKPLDLNKVYESDSWETNAEALNAEALQD